MPDVLLDELRDIRSLLARLIGSADLPPDQQFSSAALDKAAKAYTEMSIARGEWVPENDLPKYLGPCPYRAGKFVREAFEFRRAIKKGHDFLFFKADLIALGQELKARNIDVNRYKEFLDDKADFDKRVAAVHTPGKKTAAGKPFTVPKGLKNITTSNIPKPDPALIRNDLAGLKVEFRQHSYGNYIDVYKGSHAMLKSMYYYEKYLEPGLKRRCGKWCEAFNYANHALQLVTGKKEKFLDADQGTIEL